MSQVKAIEEKEKNSLLNLLTESERTTSNLQKQHQLLQSNYDQVSETLQELQEDLRTTTCKLEEHVTQNSLQTAHMDEVLEQLKELQQLLSYSQDETLALKQLVQEKDEHINTLQNKLEDHVTNSNKAVTSQYRPESKSLRQDNDHVTESSDDSSSNYSSESSHSQKSESLNNVNLEDQTIKKCKDERRGNFIKLL